jgi:OmcA/MtrC family decaheme c-type cytochrome
MAPNRCSSAGRFPLVGPGGLLLLSLVIAGCGGSDGSDGPSGPPGPEGPPGVIDISNATELNAQITGVTVSSPPVVTFRLSDGIGREVLDLPADSISFTFAKLIPGTNGQPTVWQSYINRIEQPGVGPGTRPQTQATTENGSEGSLTDNGDGTYQYTFATDVTRVTTPVSVSWQPSLTHRVSFEIRGFAPVDNPVFDFRPSSGATGGLLTREIVKTETCNVCHENLSLHGGARFETRQCVTCHNPGSTDANSGNSVDFKQMIHKIHRGEDLPSVMGGTDYCIYGSRDRIHCYGEVGFPQDIRNCSNCHDAGDPDTPDAANWYTMPTAEACGSCHDDVDFATGKNHSETTPGGGIVADNSLCAGCHTLGPSSPIEVRQAHRILPQEEAERFRYNILDVQFSGLGMAPLVTFSITDPTNGNRPYDLAVDREILDSNLRFTTGWTTSDYFNAGSDSSPAQPDRTPIIDNGQLNPAAVYNGDGSYTLAAGAVPAGTAIPITGSGVVTLEGHPVVNIGGTPTEVGPTTAAAFFAIDDSVPVPRRQSVDLARCLNCHQKLSLHGDNRNDNIDACVVCHNADATDINQRPAPPTADGKAEESIDFKRMIHKIHAADIIVYGFGGSENDFTDVAYPQRLSNCTACHTDDGFYPMLGNQVLATTIDTGADLSTPLDDVNITANTSACSSCHTGTSAAQHMVENGGSFDACQGASGLVTVRVDNCGPGGTLGPTTTETCPICHGPGSVIDAAVVHDVD